MKKVHADRLLKLADFLHALPPEKFDFGVVVNGPDMPRKELDCGSVGCAVGWCPVVFPKLVKYRKIKQRGLFIRNTYVVVAKDLRGHTPTYHLAAVGKLLFGLSHDQSHGLFNPGDQDKIGYAYLGRNASNKQVAAIIRRFVARERKKA